MPLPDIFSSWELIFRPVSDPPDDDIAVLASDGESVDIAILDGGKWMARSDDGGMSEWPGVIGWADLHDPGECIADLIKI